MRTTITLDHDVAQRAKAARARTGKTFKHVINEALRAGFDKLEAAPKKGKPFKVKATKMGLRPGLSIDNIGELLAQVEGEDWAVILVDVNLILYAEHDFDPLHQKARQWWEQQLSRAANTVCLCWPTILAFLRLSTSPRMFKVPLTVAQGVDRVAMWLAQPNVRVVTPTENHWDILADLLVRGQASGNLVSDAELAALAIEHGCELQSTDSDFSRFPGLKWRNPLR